MVSLLPPKRYWLWIALGVLLTLLLSFVIPILAVFLVAALFAFIAPGPGGKLRKFFMFIFYFLGAFLAMVGVLIALGATVGGALGAFTDALAGLFTIVIGWIVGAVLVLFGLIMFVIGNFIAD